MQPQVPPKRTYTRIHKRASMLAKAHWHFAFLDADVQEADLSRSHGSGDIPLAVSKFLAAWHASDHLDQIFFKDLNRLAALTHDDEHFVKLVGMSPEAVGVIATQAPAPNRTTSDADVSDLDRRVREQPGDHGFNAG